MCGIVMPIAETDGCPPKHWVEVLEILRGCCEKAGFRSRVVSDAADSGTILRRIVSNLYNDDLIIADVSGKNANVMFELGMRLAFDKPAIVIKDDSTGYSFDTGVIEHIGYPRDLHYPSMIDFQEKLTSKLSATLQASKRPHYTTFLQHFGEYTAKKLESTELSSSELILKTLEEFRDEITILRKQSLKIQPAAGQDSSAMPPSRLIDGILNDIRIRTRDPSQLSAADIMGILDESPEIRKFSGATKLRFTNHLMERIKSGPTNSDDIKYFW